MEASEGSVTQTLLVPIPEVCLSPRSLRPEFRKSNEKLLSGDHSRSVALAKDDRGKHKRWSSFHALPKPPTINFGNLAGTNINSWRFWFESVEGQINEKCHYDYPVQFVSPKISADLKPNSPRVEENSQNKINILQSSGKPGFSLDETKLTVRIHYYPFGLVAIRFRLYFKSIEPLPPYLISELINEILPNIRISAKKVSKAWETRLGKKWGRIKSAMGVPKQPPETEEEINDESPLLFDVLRADILGNILSNDVSNFSNRVMQGTIQTFPVVYLYNVNKLERNSIVRILTHEHRDLSDSYVDSQLIDEIGRYLEDNIFVSTSGIFVHTTVFDHMPVSRRRSRRLALLNNLYTGSDLGIFTRGDIQLFENGLKDIDEDSISGKFIGAPAEVGTIKRLDDIVTLPQNFRGTQRHVYNLLKEEQNIRSFKTSASESASLLADHDSKLRELLKNIPLPFGF